MSEAATPAIAWLPKVATGTLAAGVALRAFLVGGDATMAEGLASGLMLLGGGLVLADRAHKWKLPARGVAYVIPLVFAAHLGTNSLGAWARAAHLLAMSVAAFALRDLVVSSGAMSLLRRTLVTGGTMLGVFGIAQTLYLRPAIAEEVLGTGHPLESTAMAEAFLTAWRASTVFTSANVFASFLLITLLPCLLAALLGRHSRAALAGFGIIGLGALASAGSAGSLAAILLGTSWAFALTEGNTPRRRLLVVTASALSIGALAVVGLAFSGGDLPAKLATLHERLGYWSTAWRALRLDDLSHGVAWLTGGGPNSVGPQMIAASATNVPFSRDPHQSTLSIALEWGIPFLALLLWVLWRRLAAARASCASASGLVSALTIDPTRSPKPLNAMAWGVGLALGTFLAVLMQPLISFFPPKLAAPVLVDAMIFTALGIATWRAVAHLSVMTPAFDRALFAGTAALVLHAQLDIHPIIPAILMASIVAFVALPGHGYCPTTRAFGIGRLFATLLGVSAVLGSLPLVLKIQALVLR